MEQTRHTGIGMTSARTRDRLVQRLEEQGIRERRVLELIRSLPRHLFVDEALASRAYEDTALPIGFGQTISQPYIVAKMSEAILTGGPLTRVLEIGTGCGYQTAVLAAFAAEVYTLERIEPLVGRARRILRELKIRNVRFRLEDGSGGWPARAPFDAILLTAAPHAVPAALLEQLALGGRLVAPVGAEGHQQLMRYTRTANGLERSLLGAVSFVPLLSGLQR
ncbi:MAG TPA: protein-L-isoaspartate(D-aspartate) O-methyltransferase [Steroidobacteraceae bacterium]|nr:protein-L-isoaspartate(D-aspartate) O-methyltransferase [Steroidobacteraceae bacterium]